MARIDVDWRVCAAESCARPGGQNPRRYRAPARQAGGAYARRLAPAPDDVRLAASMMRAAAAALGRKNSIWPHRQFVISLGRKNIRHVKPWSASDAAERPSFMESLARAHGPIAHDMRSRKCLQIVSARPNRCPDRAPPPQVRRTCRSATARGRCRHTAWSRTGASAALPGARR